MKYWLLIPLGSLFCMNLPQGDTAFERKNIEIIEHPLSLLQGRYQKFRQILLKSDKSTNLDTVQSEYSENCLNLHNNFLILLNYADISGITEEPCSSDLSIENIDTILTSISRYRAFLGSRYNRLYWKEQIIKADTNPQKKHALKSILERITYLCYLSQEKNYSDEDRGQINIEITMLKEELLEYPELISLNSMNLLNSIPGVNTRPDANKTLALAESTLHREFY